MRQLHSPLPSATTFTAFAAFLVGQTENCRMQVLVHAERADDRQVPLTFLLGGRAKGGEGGEAGVPIAVHCGHDARSGFAPGEAGKVDFRGRGRSSEGELPSAKGMHTRGFGNARTSTRGIMAPTITRLATAAVVLLLLVAWRSAEAQQTRVARIGVITHGSPAASAAFVDTFRQRLRELGYAEGRNVVIEIRTAAEPERFRELAAELVALGVDVIVASGTATTRAAREVTTTIPIVMVGAGDAVSSGLVKSLRRPGGNVTGQSFMGPDIGLKALDLLMEVLPRTKRVAALYSPEMPGAAFDALRAAAQSRGVTLQRVELRRADDLDATLASMGQERPNALLAFAVRTDQLSRIVEFAAKNRLPTVYGFREAVDAGGLMSFGPRLPDLWRGAANYVDRIFKGAKPGDLPVEQPIAFELAINLQTAKALGLTVPQSLLLRADEVIQ